MWSVLVRIKDGREFWFDVAASTEKGARDEALFSLCHELGIDTDKPWMAQVQVELMLPGRNED